MINLKPICPLLK